MCGKGGRGVSVLIGRAGLCWAAIPSQGDGISEHSHRILRHVGGYQHEANQVIASFIFCFPTVKLQLHAAGPHGLQRIYSPRTKRYIAMNSRGIVTSTVSIVITFFPAFFAFQKCLACAASELNTGAAQATRAWTFPVKTNLKRCDR